MSVEDRFYAAVNVINGLPKHGPYQPSNEMKLSFYAYYKQATEGPNTEPKPWSWEVVKRAKWDVWNRLADMSKDEAMSKYVEELNKIVETMSYTENVADFLKSMDEFNSEDSIKDVIPLACPPSIEPPFSSPDDTNAPDQTDASTPSVREELVEEEEDEFYTDSVETAVANDSTHLTDSKTIVVANGSLKYNNTSHHEKTTDILMRTVLTLRTELNEITVCVRKLEQKQKSLSRRNGVFRGLTKQTVAFIILWPIAVNLFLLWLYSRRRIHSSN